MKKILYLLQYGLTAIFAIFAFINAHRDYAALKTHLEWSTPTYVVWMKFVATIIVAIFNFLIIGYLRKKIGG